MEPGVVHFGGPERTLQLRLCRSGGIGSTWAERAGAVAATLATSGHTRRPLAIDQNRCFLFLSMGPKPPRNPLPGARNRPLGPGNEAPEQQT